MKKTIGKYSLLITAASAILLALPAQAVQVSFSGSNQATNGTVTGSDILGNTWTTSNGPQGVNSSFTMADRIQTPQAFNSDNYDNGQGTFANSFQLTVNKSQQGAGFKGITQEAVASGLANGFMVQDIDGNDSSWYSWMVSYNLFDSANNLFQQILFTAPTGKQLSQGQDFKMNVNFGGNITTDSSWGASWDDRLTPVVVSPIPEPTTLALMGLGLVGLMGAARRKKA